MTRWLDTLSGELDGGHVAMLVIVARVEGSGPREAGARMIVTETGLFGTIGGGQLEYEALKCARAELGGAPDAFVRRFPLGPELGQCCGGVVTLLFEPFTAADAAWVRQLCERTKRPFDTVRRVERRPGGSFARAVLDDNAAAGTAHDFQMELEGDAFSLTERLADLRQPLWLFGAGHVGRALVETLAPLPFRVTWVDGRLNGFPQEIPAGTTTFEAAMPELLVDEAPPGTMFLVMTHSHALDEDICEAVLKREDFAYLGLIGSATKAARFASRLKARGLEDRDIERLTCPIGLPGIAGKAPEVIAASVAADLLMRLEQMPARHGQDSAIKGSLNV